MNTANFESIHIMIDAQVWRNLPLHLRLYHAFRQLVISGALVDGAKLPSARALAQQLRLSRDTVENAYSQLQRDGFMTRRQGAGSFASRQGFRIFRGSTACRHRLARRPHLAPAGRRLPIAPYLSMPAECRRLRSALRKRETSRKPFGRILPARSSASGRIR